MSRQNIPRISETEWEIMQVVWAGHPLTASEIILKLAATDPTWHPKTAKTLLARLVKKGVLGYELQSRAYVYTPLITQEECVTTASVSFLDRVFGGNLKPMFAHFVEHQELSNKDLRELERLLARKIRKR